LAADGERSHPPGRLSSPPSASSFPDFLDYDLWPMRISLDLPTVRSSVRCWSARARCVAAILRGMAETFDVGQRATARSLRRPAAKLPMIESISHYTSHEGSLKARVQRGAEPAYLGVYRRSIVIMSLWTILNARAIRASDGGWLRNGARPFRLRRSDRRRHRGAVTYRLNNHHRPGSPSR